MISGISPALSALKALEKKLGVSANNTANSSTKGYKSTSAGIQDVSTQPLSTSAGAAQVGRGVALGTVSRDFTSGSYEPSASPTDMAVGGDGFFVVKDEQGRDYYTQDGQFHFDKDGRFVTTSGLVVQGWGLDPATGRPHGAVTDIILTSLACPPSETTYSKTIVNLDADSQDRSVGPNTLSGSWDGDNSANNCIGDNAYAYQTSIKVYDSVGSTHDVTFYFDKEAASSTWEYIVTVNPAEDKRPGAVGDNLGLLARGRLVFDISGNLSGMTMDTNNGTGAWTAQDVSTDLTNGHFTYQPDFLGSAMSIELDLGSYYDGAAWVNQGASSTQHAATSNTVHSSANGHGAGDLQAVSVGPDGTISGSYSNGEVLSLFQVAVARFNNPQGLSSTGGNLYARTPESGDAITGRPGTNGLGGIVPNALEQSNVDLAAEAVRSILIKRGFQANLNVIRTEDEMIGDLLDIKS